MTIKYVRYDILHQLNNNLEYREQIKLLSYPAAIHIKLCSHSYSTLALFTITSPHALMYK